MMKIWIPLGLLIIAAFIGFMILLPSANFKTINKKVDCTENGAGRLLLDTAKWQQWWPGTKVKNNEFQFNDYQYRVDKLYITGFEATIFHQSDSAKVVFTCQQQTDGQSNFQWQTFTNFSKSLLARIGENVKFKEINKNVLQLADSMQRFFSNKTNIYGLNISQQIVKDTTLIAIKDTLDHYPSVAETYQMIDRIKNYISIAGGQMHNSPMLNVYEESPGLFYVMVAIPTNKDLPQKEPFLLKKMIRGYILTATIEGGPYKIKQAEKTMADYASDYKKLSPAIPYQSLTTDRRAQPDTLQWITTLNYPVFY